MPHAAFLGLSIVCALLFQALSALFALIETGATEPLSPNLLSLASAWAGVVGWGGVWGLGPRLLTPAAGCWPAVPAPRRVPTHHPARHLAHASPADGSRFATRRFIKFTLPLVPVALRTVPRWEVGAGLRWGRGCYGCSAQPALRATIPQRCSPLRHPPPNRAGSTFCWSPGLFTSPCGARPTTARGSTSPRPSCTAGCGGPRGWPWLASTTRR